VREMRQDSGPAEAKRHYFGGANGVCCADGRKEESGSLSTSSSTSTHVTARWRYAWDDGKSKAWMIHVYVCRMGTRVCQHLTCLLSRAWYWMYWRYHQVDKLDKVQCLFGRCGAVSGWRGVGPRIHVLGHFIYTVFGPRRMSNSGEALRVKRRDCSHLGERSGCSES